MENNIFREYDIRGLVDTEIFPEDSESIGKGFGTMMLGIGLKNIVIGCDNRESSPILKEAFIEGIKSTGCNVIDIGTVTTPLVYFSVWFYGYDGGVNITASHNGPEYNGFKLCKKFAEPFFGEDIQELFRLCERGDFASGLGNVVKREVIEDYIKYVKSKITINKSFKVVIDCGNGVAGLIGPEMIKNIGCDVVQLYCDLDGTFPNHLPDPVKPENLSDLIQKVKSENADLGIAFDGDGDRIGVVDKNGRIFNGDELMIMFSKEVISKNPGAKILFEVKCSQNLYEKIKEFGGEPIIWKTGHSLIKDKMKKEKALLAGEMSGHMFFRDEWFGFDDAVYAACRVLRILSNENRALDDIIGENIYISSPEIRVSCSDDKKFEIVKQMKDFFVAKYPESITVDGIRVVYPFGWGLIRVSNTSPKIILRFEADSEENLQKIENEFRQELSKFPGVGEW